MFSFLNNFSQLKCQNPDVEIKGNHTTQHNSYWLTCGDMKLRQALQAAATQSTEITWG